MTYMEDETSTSQDTSLAQLVQQGTRVAVESSTTNAQETITRGIDQLLKAQDLVRQLALFSSNETIDDLSTQHIPYLLIDYHLALLQDRRQSPYGRLAALKESERSYEAFLRQAEQYEFDVTCSLAATAGNAASIRYARIEGYQREKALDEKIKSISSSRADEEEVRTVQIETIKLAILRTHSSLEQNRREQSLLESMQSQQQPFRDAPIEHSLDARVEPRAQHTGPLLNGKGQPLRPFVISGRNSTRSEMRAGVFKPDYRLPTMSIDEYLEEELRRGGIIQENINAPPLRSLEDNEDNHEAIDAQTMKARDWDEFVEANPKGWGNTMNKG